jgi:hypothetical protein
MASQHPLEHFQDAQARHQQGRGLLDRGGKDLGEELTMEILVARLC